MEGTAYKSIICDVTKSGDIERVLEEVKRCTSTSSLQLWALINNAGIAPIGYFDWLSTTSIRRVMEVITSCKYFKFL
jgi:NAD(P)-dependent dehydrogenase (short-subunit alcohol dehydrogenase family)